MSTPVAFLIVPLYATEDREPPCDGTETVSMRPDGSVRMACEAHFLYDTNDTVAYPRPGIIWGNVERGMFFTAAEFEDSIDWRSLNQWAIGSALRKDSPLRTLLALREE